MKKLLIVLSLAMVALGMFGCDLIPLNHHTQYFYNLAGEGNDDSSKTLKYRSDGYTIIMSRGYCEEVLKESEANDLIPFSGFSLTLDGNVLEPIDSMSVDELDDTGYHVVQSFSLGVLSRGSHTLLGVTNLIKEGGPPRTNTVYLTIE